MPSKYPRVEATLLFKIRILGSRNLTIIPRKSDLALHALTAAPPIVGRIRETRHIYKFTVSPGILLPATLLIIRPMWVRLEETTSAMFATSICRLGDLHPVTGRSSSKPGFDVKRA